MGVRPVGVSIGSLSKFFPQHEIEAILRASGQGVEVKEWGQVFKVVKESGQGVGTGLQCSAFTVHRTGDYIP